MSTPRHFFENVLSFGTADERNGLHCSHGRGVEGREEMTLDVVIHTHTHTHPNIALVEKGFLRVNYYHF